VSSKLQITPAECRLRAAECHKMAQNARRPHVRDTLAEIERMWNRLAVEAEVSESMLTRFLEDPVFCPPLFIGRTLHGNNVEPKKAVPPHLARAEPISESRVLVSDGKAPPTPAPPFCVG